MNESLSLWRILDANANRVGEGLRVIEEYWRFALDDGIAARLIKELRHDFSEIVRRLDSAKRLAARDTVGDVGTVVRASDEYTRVDLSAVLAANWERVNQSLRALEEYGKVVDDTWPSQIEALRYRAYTLAKVGHGIGGSRTRLADAPLYLLIDGGSSEGDFERKVSLALQMPADVLQLRDKQLDDRTLLARARTLRRMTTGTSTLAIVNDRADLAALSGVDGVHVGQDELTVADARRIVGPAVLVGVSTHNREQVEQAILDGADYIGCGPTFPSSTKSFDEFPGVDFLRWVAANTSLPAFAIGGITLERIDEVLAAGFQRVAVSGGVWNTDDPLATAKCIRHQLQTKLS
jgi:thiamine-phosphate pyrophosphorylase